MRNSQKNSKKPISEDTIFKVMMIITFAVSAIFLIKNLIGKAVQGTIAITICLLVFSAIVFIMKKMQLEKSKQQFAICICIIFLVFVISLFSGSYYSDDFPLYLAIIGLSGIYLRPKYTIIQVILIDILLMAQYMLHPEKADPLPQFLMCGAILTIGVYTFYLTIKQGRAYIDLAQETVTQVLSQLREVHIEIRNLVGVDSCTQILVGLIRRTELDGVSASQLAVQLVAR